ncbi:hypothetical protein GDO78_016036 [Eleutherodactylus coqui]|uniref:Beta/gamma crystallin 'Greek key' domain-containing protein n=1 Tax=Eleutherodactylus coqui TaxID=57060 RepID=A0A8J6ECY4_ELECQ|nr:hypothetical protein GDO78_016036 [Eleutherodactylus coqui]
MNKLELFELPNFRGASTCLEGDQSDLSSVGFLQRAQSLKVCGDPWIVFTDVNYNAQFKAFVEGDYSSLSGWNKAICSARIVSGGLDEFQITLHENANYKGKSVTLTNQADSLKAYGFNNAARSQNKVIGAWALYSQENYHGMHKVTLTDDDIPNYQSANWGFTVRSLKPVTP